MNRYIKFQTLVLLLIVATFNQVSAQKLTLKDKRFCRKEKAVLLKNDQLYRQLLVQHPEYSFDSIMHLQNELDTLNYLRFKAMVQTYGYPSVKRVGGGNPIILMLHFTYKSHFDDCLMLFQKELQNGNLSNVDYAIWYDRCQINQQLPTYFGEYGKKNWTSDQKKIINVHRAEINLPPLN